MEVMAKGNRVIARARRWDGAANVFVHAALQTGVLGEGTFGVVVRACDPTTSGSEIAIKLLPRGAPSAAWFSCHVWTVWLCCAQRSVQIIRFRACGCPITVCRACSECTSFIFSYRLPLYAGITAGDFVKNFKTYVKREIVHQSSLKHPFIVSLKEVRFLSSSGCEALDVPGLP